jgi:hypothetical protein
VEPTTREWPVHGVAIILFIATIGFTCVGLVIVVTEHDPFALFWLLALGWFWFWTLRTPYRVAIDAAGTIQFRFLGRTTKSDVANVRRVGRRWGELSGFRIYLTDRTVWFPYGVRDSYSFFKTLESANPSIEFSRV